MKPDIQAMRDRAKFSRDIVSPVRSPSWMITIVQDDFPALLAYIDQLEAERDKAEARNAFKECEMLDGQPYCPSCGEQVASLS